MLIKVRVVIIAVVAAASFCIQSCSTQQSARPQGPQTTPVNVAKAISRSVPLEIQAVGNVEAYSTITVIAQVGGELREVAFQEGASVKKGDKLFVIDPRPFESQVAQAEANIVKDNAQMQALQANLARDTAQEGFAKA